MCNLLLYLPSWLRQDVSGRAQILKAQTRKFKLAADVDLTAVAAAMAENVTGADIGSVSSTAYSLALNRKLGELMEAATRHIDGHHSGQWAGSSDTDFKQVLFDMPYEQMSDIKSFVAQLQGEELDVVISQRDLMDAAIAMKPSVTNLAHYESLGEVYDDSLLAEHPPR